MHTNYKDILEKLGEPLWWDENAVPRYCEFSPNNLANIYACECVLMKIACQNCGTNFYVAMSNSGYDRNYKLYSFENDLHYLHYGDPPNTDCCWPGASMNCEDLNILQFWKKDKESNYEWVRVPKNEIDLNEVPF